MALVGPVHRSAHSGDATALLAAATTPPWPSRCKEGSQSTALDNTHAECAKPELSHDGFDRVLVKEINCRVSREQSCSDDPEGLKRSSKSELVPSAMTND
jgi:hypothetical protein